MAKPPPVCPVAREVLEELGLQDDPIAKATAIICQEICARTGAKLAAVILDEVSSPETLKPATQEDVRRSMGYTGSVCAACGSMAMVRTGTCETCQGCGATSGGCS